MVISYNIERELVSIHAEGTLTNEDMLACVKQLRADPKLGPLTPTLADISGVNRLEVTSAGIRALLAVLRETANRRGPAKVAIFTGGTSNTFMARLFKALAEADGTTMQLQTFENIADARLWLEASENRRPGPAEKTTDGRQT